MVTDEYMTIEEAASYLRREPKTIRNKMAAGVFQEGFHFFRPPGSDPLFLRSRLDEWVQRGQSGAPEVIPMARTERGRCIVRGSRQKV